MYKKTEGNRFRFRLRFRSMYAADHHRAVSCHRYSMSMDFFSGSVSFVFPTVTVRTPSEYEA